MTNWTRITTPNERVDRDLLGGVYLLWGAVALLVWVCFRPTIFPAPWEVVAALPALWFEQGLGQELLASLRINVEALAVSILIALPLAYLSRTLLAEPLARGASKLRFLSPAVFFVPLVFLTSTGHQLKVAMLVMGEAWFLLTTLLGVIGNIPSDKFDDARTLRMGEWAVTWYVVVRGTIAEALDAIRENAAMGWGMLMMVEGIVRSEGGIGVILIDASKYRDFAAVYAVAAVVLIAGIAQDAGIAWAKRAWCPYAAMKTR